MSEETNNNAAETAPEPAVAAALREKNAAWVLEVKEALGETTVTVAREHLVDVCSYLKTSPRQEFNLLSDLCGADRGVEEDPRYEVNYHLCSIRHRQRVRLKVLVSENDPRVPTVTGIWRTANWHERETYDLVGVIFDGHPDLRRILMPDDTVGHPLRKDYPLRGYEPYSLT
jgi:NADH-quinone oxidoreductase subunit C